MASASDELFAAIDAGDVDRVGAMLDVDPSLAMTRDDEGVSALLRARYRLDRTLAEAVKARVAALDAFEAATFGDVDRLAVLLEADPGLTDRRSGDGFTALHLAAFFGQDDAVRLLLGRGADPDAYGTGWMTGTPLNSAASAGHAATVDLLLEAGADPDAVQRGGWTPLHSAAHNGDARTVELLLAGGAHPVAIDDEGRSVADMAAESGDDATIATIARLRR